MSRTYKLSGSVANLGKGSGSAVLVIKNKVQIMPAKNESYVVIADTITPDLAFVLVNAEAIVTDTGGISSHAANVSRKLGIPCIVSTKYATLRINQGNQVEVDANNNLITWNAGNSCIYCNKHPIARVLQTNHFYAIFDGFPIRNGHILIIPFRHVEHITKLTKDEFIDLLKILKNAESFFKKRYKTTEYNFGINNGSAAGQTINHLHIHLIPRKNGDVPNPQGGIRNFLENPLFKYPEKDS